MNNITIKFETAGDMSIGFNMTRTGRGRRRQIALRGEGDTVAFFDEDHIPRIIEALRFFQTEIATDKTINTGDIPLQSRFYE